MREAWPLTSALSPLGGEREQYGFPPRWAERGDQHGFPRPRNGGEG
jgi:hypothetical protein